MRLVCFAGSHPRIADGVPLTPQEVVGLLLDGVRVHPAPAAATADRRDLMLMRLLRTHLRPYTSWLAAVVVLQLVGTMASLYLPSLNADIIDKGVAARRHVVHPDHRRPGCWRSPSCRSSARSRRCGSAPGPR